MFVTFLLHVNIDVMLSNLELKYFAGTYRSTRYFFSLSRCYIHKCYHAARVYNVHVIFFSG